MPSHAAAAAAAALALAGSQPEFAIHDGNFVSFLLNRPFSRDSRWTKGAPECNAGSYIEYGDDATKVALVEANSGERVGIRARAGVGAGRNKLQQHGPLLLLRLTRRTATDILLRHHIRQTVDLRAAQGQCLQGRLLPPHQPPAPARRVQTWRSAGTHRLPRRPAAPPQLLRLCRLGARDLGSWADCVS